ncbi:MAG: hypothetical protein HY240_04890 [Actinobacteria bacterium]|nr:hypothetical protein [Actinomycetota bacterium]
MNDDRNPSPTDDELKGWFAGRLPVGWFSGPPAVDADREEILVVGDLPEPELLADATPETRETALAARIQGFREDTRAQRMRIADEAQLRFGRRVSWGARCGDQKVLFTTVSVPSMTRLRMPERRVLDTLVEAGVARSRSHALAWCVRLVARHQDEWLKDLRDALTRVEKVRGEGPEQG